MKKLLSQPVRLDPSIRNLRFLLRMIGKNKGGESPVRRSLRRRLEEIGIIKINKSKLLDSAFGFAQPARRSFMRRLGSEQWGIILFSLKIILITAIKIHAQEASTLFEQANTHYQKNECVQALSFYDKIPNKGAATWYNMGNCAYQLNDQIKALLYWKRASQYGNAQIKKDAQQNMQLLSIAHSSYEHPYEKISPLAMQILFFCIFGIFLIVAYFLIQAKRWIFLAMSISVLISAGRITYQVYAASQRALIMHDESALRAGPGAEYHQICTIPLGTTVKWIKQSNNWSQIKVDGNRGWIENKLIEKI